MRITSVFLLFIIVIFSSCYPPPNFPDVPSIELKDFYFIENSQIDSLVISINFKDGDGNLGLGKQDTDFPYHQFNFYSTINGQELHEKAAIMNVPFQSLLTEAIRFSDKREANNNPEVEPLDSLPPYINPYKCTRWKSSYVVNESTIITDTLYYQRNPNYYNFYIQFFAKETINDEFQELNFDVVGKNCGSNYHGRFPELLEGDKEKGVEGIIIYNVTGSQLSTLLERKFLKLKIHIYDRALNKSNVVETPEFILSEITR